METKGDDERYRFNENGTGLGYARNVIVVKTGMAVIAVGGAYGTLS